MEWWLTQLYISKFILTPTLHFICDKARNYLVVIFHYKTHLWNGGQLNYAVEFMLGLTLRLIDSKTSNYSKVIFRYKIYIYGMVANSITYANSY